MNSFFPHPAAENARDFFIPVRKADLFRALLDDSELAAALPRDQMLQFERLLGSILHFQYFEKLDALRQAYHPVDPECVPDEPQPAHVFVGHYNAFVDIFGELLKGANFVEVSPEEVDFAHSEHAALRLTVHTPLDDFHAVRYFRRGLGLESFEIKDWLGLRRRAVDVEVYQNVVLLAAIKPQAWLDDEQRERLKRNRVKPGCVLIKCFRNIASADLNVLLPNVRIKMSLLDKLMMGVPALVGGVPIVLKLVSSLTVLFVVAGFYLGLRGTVHDEEMKSAIAALGGLVALGAFLIRQWVKYERQSLRYLKEITDKVFFRSINHNAGFFDYILGAAEEQDYKEALLAYAFLSAAPTPQTPADLRLRIENWLRNRFPLVVKFEASDALEKLHRLGLVTQTPSGYAAVPLGEALLRLNAAWDDFFCIDPVLLRRSRARAPARGQPAAGVG